MHLFQTLRLAVFALMTHKLRSGLTMLGVVIGVAAVIALVAVGEGLQRQVEQQFEAMGVNLLSITSGQGYREGPGMIGAGNPLTSADVRALRQQASAVRYVAPEVTQNAVTTYRGKTTDTLLYGVMAAHSPVRNWLIARGRFITDADSDREALVAVLSATAAQTLFGKRIDPLGEIIRINRLNFTVVGVLADKGPNAWLDQERPIIIPLRTAQVRFRTARGNTYDVIHLQATDTSRVKFAEAQARTILRARHRLAEAQNDDFWIDNQAAFFEEFRQQQSQSTRVLGSIAAIALLVGGVGIMNIMLVSVTERTREVGLRKAVGAKRRDILAQFLAEAVVLSLLGGVIGVGAGIGLSGAAAEYIAPLMWGATETLITPQSIALALGVSLAIGLFFGLYPANRAAQLNPIDALRYE